MFAAHTKAVRGVSIDLANYMLVSTSADKTIKVGKFFPKIY